MRIGITRKRETRVGRLWQSCALLLGCCLAASGGFTAQRPKAEPPAAAVPAASSQSANILLKDGKYVLQQGDEITIKVLGVPELEETAKIGPDGRLSALLLNDFKAADLTVEELRSALAARYAEFYHEPQVSVILRSFANLKVYVGGEVEHPGLFPLDGTLTALSAVLQAGGFRPTARTDSVILIRNEGNERTEVAKLNLKDVFGKGSPDVTLKPFDVVYVPMSKIAQIDRFVDQHVKQILPIPITGGFNYLLGNSSSVIRFQ